MLNKRILSNRICETVIKLVFIFHIHDYDIPHLDEGDCVLLIQLPAPLCKVRSASFLKS